MSPSASKLRLCLYALLFLALTLTACSDQAWQAAGPTSPDVQAAVVPGTAQFDQEIGAAMAAQALFTEELMARAGVVGTAVGLSSVGRPVMMVLVEDASVEVPGRLGGVGVRRMVTGTIYALQQVDPQAKGGNGKGEKGGGDKAAPVDRTVRFDRPVPIGVSTGHPAITAGTIGARVVDVNGDVYSLSNNHVYADVGAATVGDAVLQPGAFDGGTSPADDIGTLFDFEPIDFSGADNVIDAAIARSTTALLGNATSSDGYGVPKIQTMAAAVNMPVQKCGRTTGCTDGSVAGINATVNVNYGAPLGVARFVNQIVITPGGFSAGGDSGSLIVVKGRGRNKAADGRPVGLLFAGSFTATIANPIGAVLTRFGVTIDGN